MKIKIALLGLILMSFTACTGVNDEAITNNELTIKELIRENKAEERPEPNRDRRTSPKVECIFEQKAQNDDFIKNIEEIETYEWDKKTHTGTVSLENGDTLQLFRGGCDHFSIGATLRMPGKNDLNENIWKEKVLWITDLLKDELKPDTLNEAILNDDFFVQRYSPTFQALKFKSKFLRDMNYSVDLVEKKEYALVSVYLTMN